MEIATIKTVAAIAATTIQIMVAVAMGLAGIAAGFLGALAHGVDDLVELAPPWSKSSRDD